MDTPPLKRHGGTGPVRIKRSDTDTQIECWTEVTDGPAQGYVKFGHVSGDVTAMQTDIPRARWWVEMTDDGKSVAFSCDVLAPKGGF